MAHGTLDCEFRRSDPVHPYKVIVELNDGTTVDMGLSETDFMMFIHIASSTYFESKGLKLKSPEELGK